MRITLKKAISGGGGGLTQEEIEELLDTIYDWQENIIKIDDGTHVGVPVEGDRYIVDDPPAGVFIGANAGDIAEYKDGAWNFYTPDAKWVTWDEETDTFLFWNGGAWVDLEGQLDHNDLRNIQGGSATERYHLSESSRNALSFDDGSVDNADLEHSHSYDELEDVPVGFPPEDHADRHGSGGADEISVSASQTSISSGGSSPYDTLQHLLNVSSGTVVDGADITDDGDNDTITGVNQGSKTFSVASDWSSQLVAGNTITITGSTGNDGDYTVVSATWTGAVTNIVVSEVVPDGTVDGTITFVTIQISEGNILFKTSDSDIAAISFQKITLTRGIELTDEDVNWVYADYNGGSPQYSVVNGTMAVGTLDHRTEIVIGKVYRDGTALYIMKIGAFLTDHTMKHCLHDFYLYGIERSLGLEVSEDAGTDRALNITSGRLWCSVNHFDISSFDSSGVDTFKLWSHDEFGVFNASDENVIPNTQYDTGTGLADLTGSRYGVYWVFVCYNGNVDVVYGRGNYTKGQAEAATVPSDLPDRVANFSLLAAKIVIKKNETNFYEILSAWTKTIAMTPATDHNGLAALDGGTTDEYYHLTEDEYNYNIRDVATMSNGDTSPTVENQKVLKTANTGATTITTFDDGTAGQEIIIIFGDGNTTVDSGADDIILSGGADWTPAQNDTLTLVYDGTNWYETARSDNTA